MPPTTRPAVTATDLVLADGHIVNDIEGPTRTSVTDARQNLAGAR